MGSSVQFMADPEGSVPPAPEGSPISRPSTPVNTIDRPGSPTPSASSTGLQNGQPPRPPSSSQQHGGGRLPGQQHSQVAIVPPVAFDIRPRDYYLYYVTIKAPGDLIKWAFWTKKKSIAFGLYYLHNALESAGGSVDELRALFADPSHQAHIWPPPKGAPIPAASAASQLSRSNSVLASGKQSSAGSLGPGMPSGTQLSTSTTALDEAGAADGIGNADPLQEDQSNFLMATAAFTHSQRNAHGGSPDTSSEGSAKSPFEFIQIAPIERYEAFENTISGSYRVPLAGVYVLCFDNTFSFNTSKHVFLQLKVIPVSQQTPKLQTAGSSNDLAGPRGPLPTTIASVDEAMLLGLDGYDYDFNDDDPILKSGWMLKKKRKKIQGWARRWVQLDKAGILSYAEYRGGPARGTVDIRRSAIARVPHRRLITIDGEMTFHLRALSPEDFDAWSAALHSFLPPQYDPYYLQQQQQQLVEQDSTTVFTPFTAGVVQELSAFESTFDMQTEKISETLKQLKGLATEDEAIAAKYLGPMEASFGAIEELFRGLREYSARLRQLHQEHASIMEKRERLMSVAAETSALATPVEEAEEVFYDLVLSDVSESEYTDADQFEEEAEESQLDLSPPLPGTPSPVPSSAYRTKLPAPAPPCNISLASILKKSIGKDSSNMVMPMALNEPLNGLQRLAEELEYAELLDRAALEVDPLERLVYVACFAVSAYRSCISRADRKPFNPMLGETYEFLDDQRQIKYVSEKVCHRPLVLACHASAPAWCWWQEQKVKTKFWGKSYEIIPSGNVHVTISRDAGEGEDHFKWAKVISCLRNVLGSKKWIENYGEMVITNERTGDEARLTFKSSGTFFGSSSSNNEVTGVIRSGDGSKTIKLSGRWDDLMMREQTGNRFEVVWKARPLPQNHADYYGFTAFAMALNQLLDGHHEVLPPSDTRLRPDQRMLEHGRVDEAEAVMMRLVERQRETRAALEAADQEWQPRWFRQLAHLRDTGDEWQFTGTYWEAREKRDWSNVPRLW